jgi:hypothetical protein
MLQTTQGLRAFDYSISEQASPSGFIEFFELRLEAPAGLRACDFSALHEQMVRKVRVPQKPSSPAEPVQEVDTTPDTGKLHIDNTVPGSRLQKLQSAFAFKEMEQRGQREKERRAIQNQNQPSASAVAQAKEHAAQTLHDRRPRGGGGYFEVEKKN